MPPDFNVALLEHAAEDGAVYGSKAVGEPPLMLAFSVREALRAGVRGVRPGGHQRRARLAGDARGGVLGAGPRPIGGSADDHLVAGGGRPPPYPRARRTRHADRRARSRPPRGRRQDGRRARPRPPGSIGGGNLEAEAVRRARSLLETGGTRPETFESHLSDKAPLQHGVQCCGGEVAVLLEPLPVVPAVAVFGVGHVGLELARILARHDLDLHLVDSRAEHLTPTRWRRWPTRWRPSRCIPCPCCRSWCSPSCLRAPTCS